MQETCLSRNLQKTTDSVTATLWTPYAPTLLVGLTLEALLLPVLGARVRCLLGPASCFPLWPLRWQVARVSFTMSSFCFGFRCQRQQNKNTVADGPCIATGFLPACDHDQTVLCLRRRKNRPLGQKLVRKCWCSSCPITCPVHVLGMFYR